MRKTKKGGMSAPFRAYIESEIELMCAELEPVCPAGSPGFNDAAMNWISKNAARFRKKWERRHNGCKEIVVNN